MSGVRFISILTAIVAIFLWAGFVVNTWQKNKAQRLAAVAGQQLDKATADSEDQSALDRADEMAAAASEEFQKISDDLLAKDKAGSKAPDGEGAAKIVLKAQDRKILKAKNLPQRKLDEPQLIADAEPQKKEDGGKEGVTKAENQQSLKVADKKVAETDKPDNKEIVVAESADKPVETAIAPEAAKEEKVAVQKAEDSSAEKSEGVSRDVAERASKDKAEDAGANKDAVNSDVVVAEKPAAPVKEADQVEEKGSAKPKAEAKLADASADASKEKKPVWVVPDGADPQYDESQAYKVGEAPWKVPTGKDPIDLKVATKITKMAETVKDGAEDAAEKVGEKVSDIAGDVKDTIVSAKKWVVPTGNDPEYPGRDVVADDGPAWRVPDGVTPQYAAAPADEKPQDKALHAKTDKLAMKERDASIPIISYLMPEIKDDKDVVVTNKIENRLKDDAASQQPVIQKDMARLSKDLKAVPVAKYAGDDVKQELALGETTGDHDANEAKKTGKLAKTAMADAKNGKKSKVAEQADKKAGKVVKKVAKAKTKKPTLEQQLEEIKQADKAYVAKREEKAAKDQQSAKLKSDDGKEVAGAKTKDIAAVDGVPKDKVGKAAIKSADASSKATLEDKGKIQARMKNEKKPVWTVPTGNDPEVGVVAQLERGIETVKDAAVEAGSELAETVAKLPNNVKEAVASEQKWEVPTGVNWGDEQKATKTKDETKLAEKPAVKVKDKSATKVVALPKKKAEMKVAAVDAKAVDTKKVKAKVVEKPARQKVLGEGADKKVKNDKKEIITAYVPLPKKAAVPLPTKKNLSKAEKEALDKRMFVSANLKRSADEIVIAVGKAGDEPLETDKGGKTGLVTKVIDYFSDDKKGSHKAGGEQVMTALEKARFGAIKELMLDRVEYKFTNVKKGEGEIKILGRGQVGAVLALYVGPRYLGDVKANSKGEWQFNREIYLPRGQHIVQAQQMSKSGLVLARKTVPYVQKVAAKAPEGYEDSVGLALGDKALAIMKKKLKKGGGKKVKLKSVDVPLPKRKIVDGGIAVKDGAVKDRAVKDKKDTKAQKVDVAALDKSKDKVGTDKAALKTGDQEMPVKNATKVDASGTGTHYIVKSGDTLSLIAQKVYGDALRYKEIMQLNPKLKDAAKIYPKQKLRVKAADVAGAEKPVKVAAVAGKGAKDVTLPKKKQIEAAKPKDQKTAKGDKKATEKTDSSKDEFYTVVKGDSLWIIAKKVYGNGARYQELIKLNPALTDNPTLIRPDLKLKVRAS